MRQLEASIRTFNLDRVKMSLTRLGVTRLRVSEAQLRARGANGAAAFLPRIRVRVTVPDAVADQAAELLAGAS
jgi:nitrogen regulatory protein PII